MTERDRRVRLRSLSARASPIGEAPTVEEARHALGGPAHGSRPATLVEVDRGAGRVARGVVVHALPDEEDVWIGEGIIARVRAPERPRPIAGPSGELEPIARDLLRFATLRVGDPIVARKGRATLPGRVVELCRYGALCEVEGRIMAVSFRSLEPR